MKDWRLAAQICPSASSRRPSQCRLQLSRRSPSRRMGGRPRAAAAARMGALAAGVALARQQGPPPAAGGTALPLAGAEPEAPPRDEPTPLKH